MTKYLFLVVELPLMLTSLTLFGGSIYQTNLGTGIERTRILQYLWTMASQICTLRDVNATVSYKTENVSISQNTLIFANILAKLYRINFAFVFIAVAYIVGGYDGFDDIYNDIWRLDLEKMKWTKLPVVLEQQAYFHSSIIHDGKIITFGGVHNKESTEDELPYEHRINSVQTCYVKICSLKQMCWDAVNYYCQDLAEKPKINLIEEGIPEDLLSQLHA